MNIKDSTQRQFDKAMEIEGKTVYDFYTLEEYKVFFRRSYSSKISTQRVKMYFSQNTNIRRGSIIVFKDDIYIVGTLNYYESDIYYVADAVKCMAVVSAGAKDIPLAITGSAIGIDAGTITMINGNMSFYTQFNENSKDIKINNMYNIFGRQYTINNTYVIDGLLIIVADLVVSTQGGISVVRYLGENTINERTPLYYSLIQHDSGGDVVFSKDNIIGYTSSDDSVASVDDHGVLTPISNGTTTITITYRVNSCLANNSGVTNSYSHVITVNGITPPTPDPSPSPTPVSNNICSVTHTGTKIGIGGGAKTFTVNCFDENGNAISFLSGTWGYSAVDMNNNPLSYTSLMNVLIISDDGNDKKKIAVDSNARPMDLTVSYTLDENGYVGSTTIPVRFI